MRGSAHRSGNKSTSRQHAASTYWFTDLNRIAQDEKGTVCNCRQRGDGSTQQVMRDDPHLCVCSASLCFHEEELLCSERRGRNKRQPWPQSYSSTCLPILSPLDCVKSNYVQIRSDMPSFTRIKVAVGELLLWCKKKKTFRVHVQLLEMYQP